MTMQKAAPVPHHLEDTVATIAALHAAHDREAHALQKAVSRATGGIARPVTLILITTAIAVWVTLNLTLPELGHAAFTTSASKAAREQCPPRCEDACRPAQDGSNKFEIGG
jgi:hypothetical protein